MPVSKSKTVWSFDLGIASRGEAVRYLQDNSFPHKASLRLPEDFAATKHATSRRRMMRTRESHKAREAWLDGIWRGASLTPLVGRRVKRQGGRWQQIEESQEQRRLRGFLEREFPKKGDSTCYNSALLRIKLLCGEQLEEWQIYKALHSAIQKRGYGRVPWASREAKRKGKTEEEFEREEQKKDPEYLAAIGAWAAFKKEIPDEDFHFPCYYDARRMKLWDPEHPHLLIERIDCNASSTRKVRFDRTNVNKEIRLLANNAAKQLPVLKEFFDKWIIEGCRVQWTTDPISCTVQLGKGNDSVAGKCFSVSAKDFGEFVVHGPAGEGGDEDRDDFAAYLQYRINSGIHPGSLDDWMGATAQKIPRFDNRIINDCALLEGMQVCNVAVRYDKRNGCPYVESLLASEVTFLMKLKNTLVAGAEGHRKLSSEEILKIFKIVSRKATEKNADLKDYSASVIKTFSLTEAAWHGKELKGLGLFPLSGHEVIKAPKTEGRSRYSRPALRLIKALILRGDKPSIFKQLLLDRNTALLNEIGMDVLDEEPIRGKNGTKNFIKQPRPWILRKHLKFLDDLIHQGDSWEGIHIPEQRMDALEARHTNDGIVGQDDAIRELIGSINDPLVRHRLDLFAKRIKELHDRFGVPEEVVLEFVRTDFMGEKAKKALSEFQKKREESRKEALEQAGKSDALKYELGKAQDFICLYCGQQLPPTSLDRFEIDHIVPRKQGGPDAMVNYVLACAACNDAKLKRTPFEWLRNTNYWDAYVQRVESRSTALRNKKVQLLLREDAAELVDRYTALAETAWISKLAQKIISLHFGWRNGIDEEGVKRVIIVSGGLTARIRRKYNLNSILDPCPEGMDPTEWETKVKKNRSDKRHHALDAMIINFLPQWARDAQKQYFFRFPDPIQKNAKAFFSKEISGVFPEYIAYEKAVLEETIYGARGIGRSMEIVQRVPLFELGMKPVAQNKKSFDSAYLFKQLKSVREPIIAELIREWFNDSRIETDWRKFCETVRIPRRDGSLGSRVIRVNVTVGSPDEYAEMSKDQTGSFKKGKRHKGQIVYWNEFGELKIRAVFAHASVTKEIKKIENLGGKAKFYELFNSECLVEIQKELGVKNYSIIIKNQAQQSRRIKPTDVLPAGTYLLATISAKNQDVVLERPDGNRVASPLRCLIEAGMKKIQ